MCCRGREVMLVGGIPAMCGGRPSKCAVGPSVCAWGCVVPFECKAVVLTESVILGKLRWRLTLSFLSLFRHCLFVLVRGHVLASSVVAGNRQLAISIATSLLPCLKGGDVVFCSYLAKLLQQLLSLRRQG